MNRKKHIKSVANIVFIACSIISAVMLVLFLCEMNMGVFNEDEGSRKPSEILLDEINDRIAKNYCSAILYDYASSNGDREWVMQKYSNLNMKYQLLETDSISKKEKPSRSDYYKVVAESNYDEAGYGSVQGEFYGVGKGTYIFNLDSLYSAIYTKARVQDNYEYRIGVYDGKHIYYMIRYEVNTVESLLPLKSAGQTDLFFMAYQTVDKFALFINHTLAILIVSTIFSIASLIISLTVTVKKENEKEDGMQENKNDVTFPDTIPFGVFTLIYATAIYPGVNFIKHLFSKYDFVNIAIINRLAIFAIVTGVMAFLSLIYMNSIVVRIRSNEFLKYTEIPFIMEKAKKLKRNIGRNIKDNRNSLVKILLLIFVTFGIEIALIIWMISAEWDADFGISVIVFSIMKIAELVAIIKISSEYLYVNNSTAIISSGNPDLKMDASKLWFFKNHAADINSLSDNMKIAVEKQVKSERMKTELITNMSHDIKTPLTSIINYVDLINREYEKSKMNNEKIKDYIDVLERQSARMKKLIEDLIETSKVSTGNVEMNIEECDLNVLLAQVVGEFTDRAEMNQLQIVIGEGLDKKHPVMADAKHLWRAFGNIFENACKYSFPGTRFYVDVEASEKKAGTNCNRVRVIFRNISKEPLHISEEELIERFVRGDSSRNTEGSGLGLSIASSLIELMGGKMTISIDGDMFKVIMDLSECQ